MIIFRSIFSIFFSFDAQLTHLNAPTLLNFDSSDRFLPIASQSWCSGVSKMATYIYIYRAALYVVRLLKKQVDLLSPNKTRCEASLPLLKILASN